MITRDELIQRLKDHNANDELDSTIHELFAQQATEVNNKGMEVQLDYMIEAAGIEWVDERFTYDGIVDDDERCKHGSYLKMCPDCYSMPEDAEER